jgi:hypothetical protein
MKIFGLLAIVFGSFGFFSSSAVSAQESGPSTLMKKVMQLQGTDGPGHS